MHGNRDFLVGQALMTSCGATLLADPTVLDFDGQRWLLSHGDALCLDDTEYLQFRRQVQQPAWQEAFLAKPLAERKAIARSLRTQSEARKHSGAVYADVDNTAARQWLQAAGAQTLIHGHTHRPANHDLGQGLQRVVLSDWDAAATPPRAEVLRLNASGLQRLPLAV
jgi:UDP-2,3-diacylglucosamine hydrolase